MNNGEIGVNGKLPGWSIIRGTHLEYSHPAGQGGAAGAASCGDTRLLPTLPAAATPAAPPHSFHIFRTAGKLGR